MTENETKIIQDAISAGWQYIARDADGVLKLHKSEPKKRVGSWVSAPGKTKRLADKDILTDIQWKDDACRRLRDLA